LRKIARPVPTSSRTWDAEEVRTTFVGASATAIALLAAPPADADGGPFPSSIQIVFSPTDESIVVGLGTWAILPSTDNGKTWGYLCKDVLALPAAVSSYENPDLALTASNALIAGLDSPTVGLDVSNDLGCNWNCIGGSLANQQIVDIVVRPDSPHQVLALTGTLGTSIDAGFSSQVFQSIDDGATWLPLGTPIDPTVVVTSVGVAKTDPTRLYVSGVRGYAAARTASLFVSMDDGATWVEHVVAQFNPSIPCGDASTPLCPSEASLLVAGVDPTDENRVYLRSRGLPECPDPPGYSRLYVTADGGQTFQIAKTFQLSNALTCDFGLTGEMLAFALTPDGSTVYTGTRETGLWAASTTDLAFTQVNPNIHVQCLAARQGSTGPELWACSDEVTGFIFGKSTDDGTSFTPMMRTITSMSGPIACSPNGLTSAACFTDANASACSCRGYEVFCENTEPDNACLGCGLDGGPPPEDGGASGAADAGIDGGARGGGKPSTVGNASCGCSVVGGGGAADFLAGCAVTALALRRRRGSS
jgi:hypothetical protein